MIRGLIALIAISLLLGACGAKAPSYGVGQELAVKANLLAGSTPQDCDEMASLTGDSNRDARSKMFEEGRAIMLFGGTRVRVTTIEGDKTEFRVLDGDSHGKVAWAKNAELDK